MLELGPQLLPGYASNHACFHFSRPAINEVGLFLEVLDFQALEKDFDDLGATVLVELEGLLDDLLHGALMVSGILVRVSLTSGYSTGWRPAVLQSRPGWRSAPHPGGPGSVGWGQTRQPGAVEG